MTKQNPFKLLPLSLALALVPALASAEDLIQIYDQARQNDAVLAGAEAQRLATHEGVTQATSQLLPQIGASLSYTDRSHDKYSAGIDPRENPPEFKFGTDYVDSKGTTLGGELKQSIIDLSKWTARKAAQEQANRGDALYTQAEQELSIRVATAYFNVLTAEDSLAFSQAEEKALSRQLDQAQQRFEVGLSAITDVNEAKAQHDSARAATINAQNALDDAREALRELTAKEPANLSRLREDLPLQEPVPNDMQAWVDRALADNPSLKAQEHAVSAAKANINTARSGHLPTLSGSIAYSRSPNWSDSSATGASGSLHANSRDTDRAVTLTLSVPIFTGGYTQSRVRQSVYERDFAEDTLEQQKRALIRNTRLNFRAVVAGISEVEARKQAVVSANSALEATQAGFEVGTRTIVDVLLSQRQLYQAQRDYSQARHNFVLNQLRLRQSAGSISPKDLQEVNALLQ
ncbi:TolC family outer membrane protein [Tahibacter amnicola]|uniref:TolC family outer membrane protein n=1 Tax=Tahibacter amnicola TaxID=2976241 RepID=A0ABY6BHN0_9GAMM|nr:TolC family outer membrane protein [Tahibacter amnicola]UXI69022.1 TolC family outer membrane protein [Tahibacter amnicola]